MTTTSPKVAPFGTWDSPISADLIAKTAISFEDVLVDPLTSKIYHVEKRPSEGGRNVLVETQSGKDVFGKEWNARTGVQEYGGASAIVYGDVVYFSNFADGRVYKIDLKSGGEPAPVTPESSVHRFANFAIHPKHPHLLVSILEDHTHPAPADVVTTLVTVNTQQPTLRPQLLVSGSDFYSSPAFSPDGSRLAWVQWRHPDMPWEGAGVHVADVLLSSESSTLEVKHATKLAGDWKTVAAAQPQWADSRTLLFTSDISGYQNPWIASLSAPGTGKPIEASTAPLLRAGPLPQEFGEPGWKLGDAHYVPLSSTHALFASFRAGRSVLHLGFVAQRSLQEVAAPYVRVHAVRRIDEKSVIFLGETLDAPQAIVLCDFEEVPSASSAAVPKASFKTLKGGDNEDDGGKGIDKNLLAQPEPITFMVGEGEPLHVVFYAPRNPAYVTPKGEEPPCVVSVHGGPTGMTYQGLSMRQQYFTSRGFAWVEVNYGGSSGYGRKYTDRLTGKWGVVDVSDCIEAVKALAHSGRVDPQRVLITGGSAGGYTVLAALCDAAAADAGIFAGGASSYGISNLFTLAEDTHKFESRYMEKLMGGTPEKIPEVYRERSPVFHAERIKVPLLILQGSIDPVVPPSQAEEMIKVIRSHGGRVEYKIFEGEGHGWRKAENIVIALETELAFYLDVLGLKKS